jgi:ABC-type uncharacterized transport system substrate-binding protein
MKSVSRGIIGLIVVSAILLLSDLQNRNKPKFIPRTIDQEHSTVLPDKKFKLALVHYVDSHHTEDCEKGLRKLLEDKNLREDVNFTLKVYNAQGDISTLNSIAGSVANETWDLIFTSSTPTIQMLAKKLPDAKMVFTNVGDPLVVGLGKSFEDHLPNICGISTMSDFDGLLKMVLILHPSIKRVGTVFTPAEGNSVSYKERLEVAAKSRGLELISSPANTSTEVLEAANALVAQGIEAFCQISDNLTGTCSAAIIKVSQGSKVPYYGFVSQQISQGAIAVCARDYFQAGYEAGQMGIDILAGKSPAVIPFRFVEKTNFLINLENARFYNVTVPKRLFNDIPQLKTIEK